MFEYDNNKMIALSREVKTLVDSIAKYPDWSNRPDIQSQMKMDLMILLAEHGYPPEISREEVYKDVFEQAEQYKKYR